MQVSSTSIAIGAAALSLSLGGCAPNPKNVGNGLDTDSATTEGSEDSTSDPDGNTQSSDTGNDDTGNDDTGNDDVEPRWFEMLSGGQQVFEMARMPSGGIVLGSWAPGTGTGSRLSRYSDSGEVLWQMPLGVSIIDIETLDDGRIFVAGETVAEQLRQAVLWRVSPDGVVEAELIHPPEVEDSFSSALSLSVSSNGIAYHLFAQSVRDNSQKNELWRADLDLTAQWSWSGFDRSPRDIALLPSGEVRTLEHTDSQGLDDYLMRSFSADGTATEVESIPPARFAQDDPLVLVSISGDDVWVQGLDDTSELMASFPGYGTVPLGHATHGPGVGIVMQGGDDFTALQLAPDGRTREMNFPSPCLDVVNVRDVALGLDGSLFLAGACRPSSDQAPEAWVGFILALPPI